MLVLNFRERWRLDIRRMSSSVWKSEFSSVFFNVYSQSLSTLPVSDLSSIDYNIFPVKTLEVSHN